MNRKEIIELRFYSDDLDRELSIKEYFHELLKVLWDEKEGFSGKRPFGNSGWEADIAKCLVKNGFVKGKLDSEGDLQECNWQAVDMFVMKEVLPGIFGV